MTYIDNTIKQRDSLISFNEDDHTYTYNGERFISVTTLIDDYFSHFEAEKIAAKKAAKIAKDKADREAKAKAKAEAKEKAIRVDKIRNMIRAAEENLTN